MNNRELNKKRNEIMTQSEVRKKAYEFFRKPLELKFNAEYSQFFIKFPFTSNGQEVIAMFEQELSKDFYVELYTKSGDELTVVDPKRTLLKWNFTKHLNEYATMEKTQSVDKRILIPVKELVTVSLFIDESQDNSTDDDFDAGSGTAVKSVVATEKTGSQNKEDIHLLHASVRDLYAVIHNKQVSNKPWINKMIDGNK